MAFAALPISTIVNVAVATPQQGAQAYNTSNVAFFTRDTPAVSFPSDLGYAIYLSPTQVGLDFGTDSDTFAMANALFSQQPNILAAGGYLAVIPYLASAQNQQVKINFPALPASGDFYISYNNNLTAAITHNESAASIQTALQSVSGLSSATCAGSIDPAVGLSINAGSSGVGHPFVVLLQSVFTVSSASATQGATYTDGGGNVFTVQGTIASQTTLVTSGPVVASASSGTLTKTSGTGDSTITYSAVSTLENGSSQVVMPTVTVVVPGSSAETLDQAIVRTEGLVQYFGICPVELPSQIVCNAAAAVVQPLNKLLFIASNNPADVVANGILYELTAANFSHTRSLFYGGVDESDALVFMGCYAGAGLSVVFSGSNTTITMDLKTLVGITADPSMNPTLYNQCLLAGADVYASIQGVAKVLCSGLNSFYDQVYNLLWFAGALQIAGFNYLATVSTKIPQTEAGMDGLKSALRAICEQAVANQYLAPGTWNSPDTFGIQSDLIANVAQRGYYIYSSPISQQLQVDRVARKAPLIQIAAKEAGAIQSASIIVYVNP